MTVPPFPDPARPGEPVASAPAPASDGTRRLDVLKALGDNTRYAIYLELARAPLPLATADIAESLGLHVNTVRPHLERMREVGLLDVTTEARRGVGRPHHLYALARDAPSLGLEPPSFPLLASLLLRLAADAGSGADDAIDIGREHGQVTASGVGPHTDCIDALVLDLATHGFDPERVDDDSGSTIAFGHCPFAELARQHSEIVCGLHCGMIEGFVDAVGGAEVVAFRSLADRVPCQVELTVAGASA